MLHDLLRSEEVKGKKLEKKTGRGERKRYVFVATANETC